jgi:hypothetical protein
MDKENKFEEIVEKELWDHYSALPNPQWYDFKNNKEEEEEEEWESNSTYHS